MKSKTIKEIKQLVTHNELTKAMINELRDDTRKGVQAIVNAYDRKLLKEKQLEIQYNKMIEIEEQFRQRGLTYIAGVDEAGRGPLAGPVVAAAVILPKNFKLLGLTDSKQLNDETRRQFAKLIKKNALSYYITTVDSEEIDDLNILVATKKAMRDAVVNLHKQPEYVLIDAVKIDGLPIPSRSIIKGDEKCLSIAAASVLAKVARDDMMKEIDQLYPMYGFKNNMGYGTKEHLQMIKKFGASPYHRKSFSPVKRIIGEGGL